MNERDIGIFMRGDPPMLRFALNGVETTPERFTEIFQTAVDALESARDLIREIQMGFDVR